ncbi:abhydrolase domain containing 9 (predicted) [Rattus norvegicus]|uniref:Abhydrolase domain containing 9 (Predicted) n=2 Tax=Rattus norvegicus TaxID=10116 RepID=A6K941_RAT|nr:epoxide hydrolase 3 [Rattus norvegicus]EDL89461.1 abhydrolase domain containing 9 (predicted) [Rattus norvegicus]|eukprot:NP_001102458.1 epoxide hydrolase 3 [Rattus norvegicus]
MCGGSLYPSRASVSSAGPVDPDSTVETQNKGGGLPAPAPPAQSSDHGSVVVPERKDMPEFVVTALLAPSRLSLKLLRALVMILVYLAALVAAFVYSCVALTNVLCHPRRGCCGRQRSAPECLRDPTLGEHCFLTLRSSGLRLHYVSAGRGNGPLMLFLHGFPENWFSWRYQLREFQSHFHVVAVDLRGYSPSDAPKDVDCYTVDLLLTDIKDIILGLGYSKCILVSHDWGAALAWDFSVYFPSLVDRMIVVSGPPMSVFQEYSTRHIGQLFRSNYIFLFQLPWLPEKLLSLSDFQILKSIFTHHKKGIPRLSPCELEAFLYPFSHPGGLSGPINYYRNVFRNFPLEPKELSKPTLLLWGEKDFSLQQGLVEAIESHFVPGRLESHILPGSGHWIPQSHPEEMHQYMWAFLQDLLG